MEYYLLEDFYTPVRSPLTRHRNPDIALKWSLRLKSLFHGDVVSPGPAELGELWERPKAEWPPIVLRRSGAFVPDFFGPLGPFVSMDCLEAVAGYKNIHYAPVIFEKLVNVPLPRRPRDWPKELEDGGTIFDLPHEEKLRAEVGPIYFLSIPRGRDVAPNYMKEHHSPTEDFQISPKIYRKYIVRHIITPDILSEYPLVDSHWGLVIRGDMMNDLDPYIDWRFYKKWICPC